MQLSIELPQGIGLACAFDSWGSKQTNNATEESPYILSCKTVIIAKV
jgi:hypothetical protein